MTVSQLKTGGRARSREAKSERRTQILDAALRVMSPEDPGAITMDAVAREARLAKGTLYLYFRTKEELLVGLLERGFEEWFDGIDAALAVGQGWMPASSVADLFTRSYVDRPLLRRLLARLGPVLEYNLDDERALRFKWRVAGRLTGTGALLERRTVFLRPGDGTRLLLYLHALATGLESLAEPAPAVSRVLGAPGLEPLRLDFGREYRSAAGALLTGLERTN